MVGIMTVLKNSQFKMALAAQAIASADLNVTQAFFRSNRPLALMR
jgi:hypothetical protein